MYAGRFTFCLKHFILVKRPSVVNARHLYFLTYRTIIYTGRGVCFHPKIWITYIGYTPYKNTPLISPII